ncbi:MAG: hypothetical protein ACRCVT_16540 [Leadbetterella sp.]
MRFIKEIDNSYCKTQLYSFNNKYVLKFELNNMEQIYKFSEQDVMKETDIEENLKDEFYENVIQRFQTMSVDQQNMLNAIDSF